MYVCGAGVGGVWLYGHVWRLEVNIGFLLQWLATLSFGMEAFTEPGGYHLVRLAGWDPLASPCLHLSSLGTGGYYHTGLLMWVER